MSCSDLHIPSTEELLSVLNDDVVQDLEQLWQMLLAGGNGTEDIMVQLVKVLDPFAQLMEDADDDGKYPTIEQCFACLDFDDMGSLYACGFTRQQGDTLVQTVGELVNLAGTYMGADFDQAAADEFLADLSAAVTQYFDEQEAGNNNDGGNNNGDTDGDSMWKWVLVALGAVLLLTGVIVGIATRKWGWTIALALIGLALLLVGIFVKF
uniref:Uncharacterized protein n=1 Tax=viral metagenome TaxID=1070528 RepID=A0A6C0BQN0_9ZZZZ